MKKTFAPIAGCLFTAAVFAQDINVSGKNILKFNLTSVAV